VIIHGQEAQAVQHLQSRFLDGLGGHGARNSG
jgi:hypothetical protein